MKKGAALVLCLLLSAGLVYAQEDGGADGFTSKPVYFQGAAGLMYIISNNATTFSLWALRGGIHVDLLFPLSTNFEIGAELGIYAMSAEIMSVSFVLLDMPLNALLRINFDPSRVFALEIRGGGWLEALMATSAVAEFGGNVGVRLVLSNFYLGGDYIFMSVGGFAIEAGVKFTF